MTPLSLPETMLAVHQPDKTTSHLALVRTPVPTPSHPSDVLIKVAATAPCYSELTWATNLPDLFPPDKEPVPGQDVAGTVIQAPQNSAFTPGDEVFARIDATRPGGLREYTLVLESELARKPTSMDWVAAAATPLSALTAWQALFVHGTLEHGAVFGDAGARERNRTRTVLITAAGGSVGGWVVQFAVAAGAGAVVGVCGTGKVAQVLGLGASQVVDYTQQGIDAWVGEKPQEREFDLVVDCVGGESMASLWSAVKDGGAFVSVCGMPETVKPEENTKRLAKCEFFIVESLGSQLAEIASLVEKGNVRPLIDSVYEFEDFQKAFDKIEGRHASGKVIIKVSI